MEINIIELVSWLVVFIALVVIEIATFNLVTVWFALGALGATLVSLFGGSLIAQFLVFIVLSLILFALTKPIVNRVKKDEGTKTNSEALIGKTGFLEGDLTEDTKIYGKFQGDSWLCRTKEEFIKEGTKVQVLKIEGVTLIVKTYVKEEEI